MAADSPVIDTAELEALARRGRPYVIETVALVAEIVTANEPRPVIRIGIEDTWGESAPNASLLGRHGLTPERIAERVRRVWNAE